MKLLTANFLTCAVKACKSSPLSFPLHFRDAELETTDMDYNPTFLHNILPRLEWDALRTTAAELGFTTLPETKPEAPMRPAPAPASSKAVDEEMREGSDGEEDARRVAAEQDVMDVEAVEGKGLEQDKLWRELHKLLLETQVVEGKLVCGNCGHEYKIKDGIANFLLPNHLV